MRIRSFLFVMVLVGMASTGCSKKENPFVRLRILEGTWVANAGDMKFMERWNVQNDTLLAGKGFEITTKDTMLFETLSISAHDGEVWYTAIVTGQNNEEPVPFRLTGAYEQEFVFENPEHDFPKKISYQFKNNDQFTAVVSGVMNGKSQSLEFSFSRIP